MYIDVEDTTFIHEGVQYRLLFQTYSLEKRRYLLVNHTDGTALHFYLEVECIAKKLSMISKTKTQFKNFP